MTDSLMIVFLVCILIIFFFEIVVGMLIRRDIDVINIKLEDLEDEINDIEHIIYEEDDNGTDTLEETD